MRMTITAYLAPDGYIEQLTEELGGIDAAYDRLLLKSGSAIKAAWAQNIWYDVEEFSISSIKDAAQKLRAIQRNWVCYEHTLHRRATLIQENLPHISFKTIAPFTPLPKAPL